MYEALLAAFPARGWSWIASWLVINAMRWKVTEVKIIGGISRLNLKKWKSVNGWQNSLKMSMWVFENWNWSLFLKIVFNNSCQQIWRACAVLYITVQVIICKWYKLCGGSVLAFIHFIFSKWHFFFNLLFAMLFLKSRNVLGKFLKQL